MNIDLDIDVIMNIRILHSDSKAQYKGGYQNSCL